MLPPAVAASLLEKANGAFQRAFLARREQGTIPVGGGLIPEESDFLVILSNAICQLRKANYMVQKEMYAYRTRQVGGTKW